MSKSEMWNSHERREERKARLEGLKQKDGGKKPIETRDKFTKIYLPVIAVIVVIGVGIWAIGQFAILQKLFSPMRINETKISAAEYSYNFGVVLQNLSIDKNTKDGKKKLNEKCTLEGHDNQTWLEYANELTAEQIQEQNILYLLAKEKNLELNEEDIKQIDEIFDGMVKQMGSNVKVDKYLMDYFGKSVTINSLRSVFEKYWLGNKYTAEKMKELEISDEEIEAVYNADKDDYDTVTFRLAYFPIEENSTGTQDSDKTEDKSEGASEAADSEDNTTNSGDKESGNDDSNSNSNADADAEKSESENKYDEKDSGEKELSAKDKTKLKAEEFLSKVKDEESFKLLVKEKDEEDQKAAYEKLDKEAKKKADDEKAAEEQKEKDLLATMTEEEKEEYESSQKNQDTSIIRSISKKDLLNANADMAEWLMKSDRKAGDKEIFDIDTAFYAVYFVSRETEYNLPAVRHILISPNKDKDLQSGDTFTKDEWDAARLKSNEVLGKVTDKESFIKLVKDHSTDPGSVENGGLYENVIQGQMMPAFNDWTFDPLRKEGDKGIVRTPYGYHIMWFEGYKSQTVLEKNSEAIAEQLKGEAFESFMKEQKDLDKFKFKLDSFGVKLVNALG